MLLSIIGNGILDVGDYNFAELTPLIICIGWIAYVYFILYCLNCKCMDFEKPIGK